MKAVPCIMHRSMQMLKHTFAGFHSRSIPLRRTLKSGWESVKYMINAERKRKGVKMPYITVECGILSDMQKEKLIKRLTDVASEIMEVPKEFYSVTIKELPDKNFGIGGKTIDKVKDEYIQARNFIGDKN